MSTHNPSLGPLARLPGEIRNRIYELAIDRSDEEVEIKKPCYPHAALCRASKQIGRECVGIIQSVKRSPCQHRRFLFKTLPTYNVLANEDSITDENGASGLIPRSHEVQSTRVTYSVLTSHVGKDVPLAVIITVKLPDESTAMFYGASEKRARSESVFQNKLMEIGKQVGKSGNNILPYILSARKRKPTGVNQERHSTML